nr:O-antigen ligase family protein [uncultured Pseudomonas sp.]
MALINYGFFRSIIFALAFGVFASTCAEAWVFGLDWHDQQRVGELVFIGVALLFFVATPACQFYISCRTIVLVFFLGLVSVALSEYPLWAVREWGRSVGLFAVVVMVGALGRDVRVQQAVLYTLALIALLLAGMFFTYYGVAFASGVENVDPNILLYGFDNPRFLGQFQILFFPLLIALFQIFWCSGFNLLAIAVLMVGIAQWCIAWALGGRGVWFGFILASATLLALNRSSWFFVRWQLLTAVLGGLLFWMLFVVVPEYFGIEVRGLNGLRTGLSAREKIWSIAWGMATENPWFGVGPLHFSAVWNHIAAHPHQVALQWISEWGFPAALLAISVVLRGMWCGASRIRRNESAEPLDLALWSGLFAALILAQVDGVFVMPYSEGWMAVLAGLALSRWSEETETIKWWWGGVKTFGLLALLVVLYQLFVDVPDLKRMQMQFYETNSIGSPPRLWGQGWIPM